MKPTRIDFLDYLRIFAFVSVLIGHKFYDYFAAQVSDSNGGLLRFALNLVVALIKDGAVGVVVFFLVSGYIITHVLQTERASEFLVKRLFRIYPLYILAVSIEFLFLREFGIAPFWRDLISQWTLLGDVFGTPYSLGGVEWTLRVEIMFYALMSALSALGLIALRTAYIPHVYLGLMILCAFLAPIPSMDNWSRGYLTIYLPFLFFGSMFYLYERRMISGRLLFLFLWLVVAQYYMLLFHYQWRWFGSYAAVLALLIFSVAWYLRDNIRAPRWVLFVSGLTYAVYLFHNWLYDYAIIGLRSIGFSGVTMEFGALVALIIFCALVVRFIEKPAIRLGRAVVALLRERGYMTAKSVEAGAKA